MGEAEKLDTKHKRIVKSVKESKRNDDRHGVECLHGLTGDAKCPDDHFTVKNLEGVHLSANALGYDLGFGKELNSSDKNILRWILTSWADSGFTDDDSIPDKEAYLRGFIHVHKKAIRKAIIREKSLQREQSIQREKEVDTVLDPFVIGDLRNIIKTYLKPQI